MRESDWASTESSLYQVWIKGVIKTAHEYGPDTGQVVERLQSPAPSELSARSTLASYQGHAKIKKSGLVSIVRACARIYGIGSVNISVNGLSHTPRSSTETVYGTLSERT